MELSNERHPSLRQGQVDDRLRTAVMRQQDGKTMLHLHCQPIRMIGYADYVTGGIVGWLARLFRVIPINPKQVTLATA